VLIRQDHRGTGAARRAAAEAASSEFVSILDADDLYLPDYLEAIEHLAVSRPDLDILTTDAYLEVDGRIIGRYYRDIARFVVGDQRRGAIHNHFVFGLASLRRQRLLDAGGFDQSLARGVDRDCFLRMTLAGARAGLIDAPLARYRLRVGSVSSDRAASMDEELRILERAGAHDSLNAEERAFLGRELSVKRAEARMVAAEDAVRRRRDDARSRALEVAFGELPPGFGARTRVKALATAAAPRAAAWFVARNGIGGGASTLRPEMRGR
jgi:glycosyltransferase involved in cell wall biosynthesis